MAFSNESEGIDCPGAKGCQPAAQACEKDESGIRAEHRALLEPYDNARQPGTDGVDEEDCERHLPVFHRQHSRQEVASNGSRSPGAEHRRDDRGGESTGHRSASSSAYPPHPPPPPPPTPPPP